MDQLTALYLMLLVPCLMLGAFLYFKYFRHHRSAHHR